ncbi:acyl-CoA dehydrogenase [Pseudomonas sp.]|uniref:acyl-CoA dehydrogenase n=1 Tax=Pseudomonas sp. TaxID=306 RepID=UPI003D12119B
MTYTPPTTDQKLALTVNAGLGTLAQNERYAAATPDVTDAIVEGIAAFAAGEWEPLSRLGDQQGAVAKNGVVTLPAGFDRAYRDFAEQGWGSIAGPVEHGGQGLPSSLAVCVLENLGTANLAFSLLPMLSVGAAEALAHHGSEAQKKTYLPKLISGEWTGTMNLTESQAGSDVGALRTTATPINDGEHAGKYRIKGTKIFITWGEHELADNIVHLVLARTPGAPAGSRGISLFIVPKYHVEPHGLGARNDLRVVGIEHKMGIHASPTCVMSYGDNDACIGELIGGENQGLRCMFTMMNSARINVGAQGIQVAEAALQKAVRYASERVQSPRAGVAAKGAVAIIEHPDVRRMLIRMRALTEAARALLYYTAGQYDRGSLGDEAAAARTEVLVPLLKAWATDVGCEVTSLGVQVHGGMGYVEETGAAQHFRDARIAPIYEGTNGIQAGDLVTRKLGMGSGGVLIGLLQEIAANSSNADSLGALARDCIEVAAWMLNDASLDDRLAGAVPFLAMCATAVAGWQLLRQVEALREAGETSPLQARKSVTTQFFLERVVPEARGQRHGAMAGAGLLYGLDAGLLAS